MINPKWNTIDLQDYINYNFNTYRMKAMEFPTDEDSNVFYYSMVSSKSIEDIKKLSIYERLALINEYDFLLEDVINESNASPILELSSEEMYVINKDFKSLSFDQFQNYDFYYNDAVNSGNSLKNIHIQLAIVIQSPKDYSHDKALEISKRILKMKMIDLISPISFFLSKDLDYMNIMLSFYNQQIEMKKQECLMLIKKHIQISIGSGAGIQRLYNYQMKTLLSSIESFLKQPNKS